MAVYLACSACVLHGVLREREHTTVGWGVPVCGHSYRRHTHLGPGREKVRVAGVSWEPTKTCQSGRARWATLLPDALAGILSAWAGASPPPEQP